MLKGDKMKKQKVITFRFYILLICICFSMLTGACAHKAKLVQAGAAQFETESLAALQMIDDLRMKEIEASPVSSEKASAIFVKSVKKSSGQITNATLNTLVKPFAVNAQNSDTKWQEYLQRMRLQYTTFSEIFSSLDKGSLLAARDVSETVPILDKLVAQMVAIASSIKANPAVFIGKRSEIAIELEDVRNKKPHNQVTDIMLLDIEKRLREILTAEEKITMDTTRQALKAAKLGSELRKLIVNYDKLSVDDIADGLTYAFKLAGSIPGMNISGFKAETESIIEQINQDPNLKKSLDEAFSQLQNASRKSPL
jgi:hypothetical protein